MKKINTTMFNKVGNGKKKTDYTALQSIASGLKHGEYEPITWGEYFGKKSDKKYSEVINAVNYRLSKNTENASIFFSSVDELNKGIVYVGNRKATA